MNFALLSLNYVISRAKETNQKKYKEMSFQLAEAGIEYYRWHLAHNQTDFKDGTLSPGPYVHSYSDADGNPYGQFSLEITTPASGSTLTTIISTGASSEKNTIHQKIKAVLGRPSFTDYAVVANDEMRFGTGTEVFGPIHSNYGIRFDGFAHNIVSSSETTYDDPDHGGSDEWAVHTHATPVDALPPQTLANRPDVFGAGRAVDSHNISFAGITGDLDDYQAAAAANGIYLSDSNAEGYRIHFRNDHKVEIYRITSQQTCQLRTCFHSRCWWTDYTTENLWSANGQQTFDYHGHQSNNLSMPTNGLIFAEDDVWVDGQVNGDRVTVVAARTPYSTGNANIIINNDLRYTNYDGQDAIGLIAQTNVYSGFYSEDDLRIDAAMIAQKGMVGRLMYPTGSTGTYNPANCNQNYIRSTFTNYGAIGTNQRYGFAYVCGSNPLPACAPCGTTASGYCTRNLLYDNNFYFAPPPYFPVTDQYRVISWEEQD